MALSRLGVCAHEAVMIGDDVIGDISGAAALGISPIQTIEFTEAVQSEQADHVVTQLGRWVLSGTDIIGFLPISEH